VDSFRTPRAPLCQLTEQDIGTPHNLPPEKAQAAGQIPRPKSRTARPLKSIEVDALVAGYGAGRTMKELAGEFGIDRRIVSSHLRRAEVLARRGASMKSRHRLLGSTRYAFPTNGRRQTAPVPQHTLRTNPRGRP